MKNGGTIRDTGKKIYFYNNIQTQAEQYAQKKWGKNIVIGDDGGILWQKRTISKRLNR